MKTRVVFLLIPALAPGCGGGERGDVEAERTADVVAAAPSLGTVVFENDYVQATLFRLAPGEALPEHAGHPRAVCSLSDHRILWTESGTSEEKEWGAGQAHWHDGYDHAVRNIGESEAVFLVVARKGAAFPDQAGSAADAAAVEGGHGVVVFENDHVRVTEVTLAPGVAQAPHHGLHRLVYSSSDYSVRYTSEGAHAIDASFAAGEAHWHDADEHAVENTGSTEARFVLFQFRR